MNIQQYFDKICADEHIDANLLRLSSNEPSVFETARTFAASQWANRYYFSGAEYGLIDFGAFTSLGMSGVQELVTATEDAAKERLGAILVDAKKPLGEVVDVSIESSTHA